MNVNKLRSLGEELLAVSERARKDDKKRSVLITELSRFPVPKYLWDALEKFGDEIAGKSILPRQEIRFGETSFYRDWE